MGLEKYVETFKLEKISGELMCELNDAILEKELKIQSQLHRIRLMMVIRGDTDVKQFL